MNRYRLFLTVLLLTWPLMAGNAAATAPRSTALGGASDYFEDDSTVLRWYGSLGDYGNAATLDFGHFNIYKGYHDDQEATLSGPAVSLRHDLGEKWGRLAVQWNGVADDLPTPTLHRDFREDAFSLLYGRKIGPVQGGLLYQTTPEQKQTLTTATGTSRMTVWGLGARFDICPRAYLDLAVDLRSHEESFLLDQQELQEYSTDLMSRESFGLRSRLFRQLGERTALVAAAEYLREIRPVQKREVIEKERIDGHFLKMGLALNFFPDTDRMLYVAGEWNQGKADYLGSAPFENRDWTNDWNSFALQAGWETRYLAFVTLRGAVGYRLTRGDGYPAERTDLAGGYDYDDLWFALGTALHLKGWDLDVSLSQKEPRPVMGDWEWPRTLYASTWMSVSLRYSY